MIIIPAIDLIGGEVVRLTRGDYATKKVYSTEPVAVAEKWRDCGAGRIHVVDLDGAKAGEMQNLAVAKEIKRALNIEVQYGGGIRTPEALASVLEGTDALDYAIIGTKAIEDPSFLKEAVTRYGAKIIVGIDIYKGVIKTAGWLKDENKFIGEVIRDLQEIGVKTVICTDILKDGTLSGIADKAIGLSLSEYGFGIILAGGISRMSDIELMQSLKVPNLVGAIVGKAIYEETLNLKKAIERCSQKGSSPA